MKINTKAWLPGTAGILLLSNSYGTELIHTPVNPSFGGSPLNGNWMLGAAQAQNKFKEPTNSSATSSKTALEQFNDTLQRTILSRIASAATQNIVDSNGNLVPGIIDTGAFNVTIIDNHDGTITITTTDKQTGSSTTFELSQPNLTP